MNKKYILTKSYDIEELLKKRNSVGSKYYVIYYIKTSSNEFEIAISASKKLGNAVIRNYNKRVTREIIREKIDLIKGFRMLLVIKPSSLLLSYEEKKKQVDYIIKKLINKEKETR